MSNPTTGDNKSPSPFIQAMSADQRKEYMRRLGQRSGASRLVLSGEEKKALGAAYDLIRSIADRHDLSGSEASNG